MKANKLTPGYNLLWESSRIILPEHAEAIRKWRQEQNVMKRPQLDEQELERISLEIQRSMRTYQPIKLRLYDPYEELYVEGVVERVDSSRIRVNGDWFLISDIIGID